MANRIERLERVKMGKEEGKFKLNPVIIADILKKKILFDKARAHEMMNFDLAPSYEEDLRSSECETPIDDDGIRGCTATPVSDGTSEKDMPFDQNENNQVDVAEDNEEIDENGNVCVKITDVFSVLKNWFMRCLIAIPLFILNVKCFIFNLIRCSGENKEEQDVQELEATGDIFEMLYNKKDDEDADNNSLESLESDKTIVNGKYYRPVRK